MKSLSSLIKTELYEEHDYEPTACSESCPFFFDGGNCRLFGRLNQPDKFTFLRSEACLKLGEELQ